MSNTKEELDVERQKAMDIIQTQARGIQDLLKTYAENNKRLYDDVQAFSSRDDAEQGRLDELMMTVAQTEMRSLQSGAFLSYRMKYQCGTQHAKACSPPNQGQPSSADEHSWAVPLAQSRRRVTSGSEAETADAAPWSLPQRVLPLSTFPMLQKTLLGWREGSDTAELRSELGALIEELFSAARDDVHDDDDDVSVAASSREAVCLFNGLVYTPSCTPTVPTVADPFRRDAAHVYEAYCNHVVDQSVINQGALEAALLESIASQRSRSSREEQPSALSNKTSERVGPSLRDNAKPFLIGDGQDTIALARASTLRHTQLFRGFFFAGHLVVVEHIGAEVDVLPLFTSQSSPEDKGARAGDAHATLEATKERICAVLTQAHRAWAAFGARGGQGGGALPRSVAIVAALTTGAHPMGAFRALVLDVRPVSPSLPFQWRVSWGELCVLGQVHSQVPTSTPTCTLFKATELLVASLKPHDTLSAEIFPSINGELLYPGRR